jgi:predicted DNA-binding protein (UPF0251 family)
MSPRPKKVKTIKVYPNATYFKPRGLPLAELKEIHITLEEFEAIRLSDFEGLSQSDAASSMNIHQSTFQRITKRARKKISDALLNGKAIRIGGD